jgi:prephenate dehydratase
MTRFVIIKKENLLLAEDINRASLKFELDHKRGSLAVLNVMSDCKMNLTNSIAAKVETPWKYSFL